MCSKRLMHVNVALQRRQSNGEFLDQRLRDYGSSFSSAAYFEEQLLEVFLFLVAVLWKNKAVVIAVQMSENGLTRQRNPVKTRSCAGSKFNDRLALSWRKVSEASNHKSSRG